MVARRPLVNISGLTTELPPGDSIVGGSVGTLIAGSGLNGGGNLSSVVTTNVSLAPNPSGLLFVDGKLGVDGVARVAGAAALASGNFSMSTGTTALASGIAGSSLAATALASGNAALADIAAIPGGTIETFTAASAVASGYAVGLDDNGKVQSLNSSASENLSFPSSAVAFDLNTSTLTASTYDSNNNKIVIAYRNNSNYGACVVGFVSGTSITFGIPVVFNSASTPIICNTYNTTEDKVIIAYEDGGNAGSGTAIVGTVSPSSISFGTPTVWHGSPDNIDITYDSTSNRVVICFRAGVVLRGAAIVGTVSGTSISFGTLAYFSPGNLSTVKATYDSTNNRVVIAYRDTNNSDYGTAVVATVSGTSISFGTPVVFESSFTGVSDITYDSSNSRIVIPYNTTSGYVIIGSVSGTTISFGTPVLFANSPGSPSSTYDSTNSRVFIAYYDVVNSNYGTAIVGSVSGTSISFGTAVVFESATSTNISNTYDSLNNRVVTAYRNGGTIEGDAIVADALIAYSYTPTVSSQANFIGIAQTTAASGSAVQVRLPGSYDQNNTGLTPGAVYYVNPTTSGFTTTATQPIAWSGAVNWGPVGRAVNSTTLLLTDMI